MTSLLVNQRLADVLGVDPHLCTGFDLRVRVGALPRLKVHTLVIDEAGVDTSIDVFALTLEPQAFDLDRACERALKRLARAVEQSAARARAQLRRKS